MATPKAKSITQQGRYEPFELQVARGQIGFHNGVNIFGYQPSIGTSFIPIWEVTSAYPAYLTTASTFTIASASASDQNAVVLVTGLDANYNVLSEQVLMTTSTPSGTTVGKYLRINVLTLTTPGSGQKTNVGQITATASNSSVYAYINAGIGKSQMAVYSVPNNSEYDFTQITINTNNAYTSSTTLTYQAVAYNNATGVQLSVLQEPFINNFIVTKTIPFKFGPRTDIQWQLKASTGTVAAGIVVEGYQIFNVDSGNT